MGLVWFDGRCSSTGRLLDTVSSSRCHSYFLETISDRAIVFNNLPVCIRVARTRTVSIILEVGLSVRYTALGGNGRIANGFHIHIPAVLTFPSGAANPLMV